MLWLFPHILSCSTTVHRYGLLNKLEHSSKCLRYPGSVLKLHECWKQCRSPSNPFCNQWKSSGTSFCFENRRVNFLSIYIFLMTFKSLPDHVPLPYPIFSFSPLLKENKIFKRRMAKLFTIVFRWSSVRWVLHSKSWYLKIFFWHSITMRELLN